MCFDAVIVLRENPEVVKKIVRDVVADRERFRLLVQTQRRHTEYVCTVTPGTHCRVIEDESLIKPTDKIRFINIINQAKIVRPARRDFRRAVMTQHVTSIFAVSARDQSKEMSVAEKNVCLSYSNLCLLDIQVNKLAI